MVYKIGVRPSIIIGVIRVGRYKFYSLGTEYNKTLTPEAKMTQANCVLLAAVSIPEIRYSSFFIPLFM